MSIGRFESVPSEARLGRRNSGRSLDACKAASTSDEVIFSTRRLHNEVELADLRLRIDLNDISRMRRAIGRTLLSARVVELAAIAVSALSVYHGMGAELIHVAHHGLAADFTLRDGRLLEVAGRSRLGHSIAAWRISGLTAGCVSAVCSLYRGVRDSHGATWNLRLNKWIVELCSQSNRL